MSPPWRYVWALALAIALVIVGGWEWLARGAGLGPEYTDNRSLWADARHRLNQHGSDAIALLGASRIQYAVDVDAMSNELGRPVVQLGVEGTSALALLENLAADPRFTGTVIYSVAPAFTFNRILPRIQNGKQREWVIYYRQQSRSRRMEQSMRLFLQGRLAFRSPDASLKRILPALFESAALPGPDHKFTFRNRVITLDYSRVPPDYNELGMVQFYLDNSIPYEAAEFEVILNYVNTMVQALKDKGAEVVFLRLPSSNEVYALESVFYPKTHYWNLMQERIDARFIHADDYPQMAGFVGGDGSHIGTEHLSEFTKVLVDILRH
ncbi:MAG: hypothetical protein ACE5F8_02865 [Woeseiaceae bacterium]